MTRSSGRAVRLPRIWLLATGAALALASGCSHDGGTPQDGGPGKEASTTEAGPALPDGYGPLWPCTTTGQACNAHDPCAINPICGADGLCHPSSVQDCSDDLSCTTDTCKGMGLCENTPTTGSCALPVSSTAGADGGLADGGGGGTTDLRCFSKGDPHPADPCKICDPDQSATQWTAANGGSCDDDNTCTKDDYCQTGVCKGTYYGSQCADQYGCTDDLCDGKGGCLGNTLKSDWCLINGVCYKDASPHPSGSCSVCDVTQSQSVWTPITDTCMIGGACYSKGSLNTGGCAECDPATSATSWTVTGSYCLINDSCKNPKDKDSTGCAECDPTKDKYGYTALTGLCMISGACYQSGAQHPGGCGECKPASSGSSWTLTSATDCLIDESCYKPGTKVGCYTCDPTQSQTAWTQITGCNNVESLATASSSGGGSGSYGPDKLNDGKLQQDCVFCWVSASSTPGTSWIQYTWPSAVVVGSVSFDTVPATTSICGASAGRTLAGGDLQYWNGTAWVTIGTITGKLDDWSYSFTQVTTTMLRLYGAHAPQSGVMMNPVIFEWQVFGT